MNKTGKISRKILLIEPPFYRLFKDSFSMDRYPLSLGYLSGTIKEKTDWDVLSYNADFCSNGGSWSNEYLLGTGFDNYLNNLEIRSGNVWKEIELTIEKYKPSVIGITAKSQNFISALIVAELARKIIPEVLVVFGGPHPSMVGLDMMKYPEIDISVIGEGENTIVELLDALENQKELDTVPGLIIRKNGVPFNTPVREYESNLDTFCFPHKHAPELLKDYDKYPKDAFKSIFATRGCPYNCFFCGSREIWSRKTRFRSYENVVNEIKELQHLGLHSVHFDDDNFCSTKKYLLGLCEAIGNDCPGLEWSCEIHVRLVDDQIISAMKEAGCYRIHLGIESGNDSILSKIRKGFTFREAYDACKIIKKHGLVLCTFFIMGFPQDTEETLNDTLNAMKKIDCDSVIFSIFTPYPGTEAFEYCLDNGIIDDGFNVALYNHQSPANYFCKHIERDRFKKLIAKAAKTVDRRNTKKRINLVFSSRTFETIKRLGIKESLRKGRKLFLRR